MSSRARILAAVVLVLAIGAVAYALTHDTHGGPSEATGHGEEAALTPRPARHARADPRPDILLFTIDSLRSDHVWSYDGSRHTTPALTTLSRRGAQFDRAYSASSWTAPAMVSLLSGALPSQHGVMHGQRVDEVRVAGQETISDALPMLAPLLHDAGYRTIAVTVGPHLAGELGFARGFDVYRLLDLGTDADVVIDEVERQITDLATSGAPYFLWVHVIDPHAPFQPREPWFDAWWPVGDPRYPEIDSLPFEEFLPGVMRHEAIAPERGLAYVMAAYDSEIRASDAALERLLGEIDHEGLAIVVTSGQGEELMDHGRFGQGHTAFEEVVRVPLVIVPPDAPIESARRIDTPVSIVDVMPTLLELASAPAPEGIAGRSLVMATRGERLAPRDIVIETGRGREVVRAIVSDHFKYGEMIAPTALSALFDLEADPHELTDLSATDPDRTSALRERLHSILDAAAARRPPTRVVPIELNALELQRLRRQGYAR